MFFTNISGAGEIVDVRLGCVRAVQVQTELLSGLFISFKNAYHSDRIV